MATAAGGLWSRVQDHLVSPGDQRQSGTHMRWVCCASAAALLSQGKQLLLGPVVLCCVLVVVQSYCHVLVLMDQSPGTSLKSVGLILNYSPRTQRALEWTEVIMTVERGRKLC